MSTAKQNTAARRNGAVLPVTGGRPML